MTDQEEKDRYERERAKKVQSGPKSSAHHSRMYRYHDNMARVLSRAMKKSGNRELKRQHDFHVSRCSHHEKFIEEAKIPVNGGKARFRTLERVGQSYQPKPRKPKPEFTMANRDDDSDDA